ncbi:MAG: toprim domain-containing protein [Steroidobacteraceae bacterium]
MNGLLELGIQANPGGPAEQRVACPQCSKREHDDALGVNLETGVYHCFRCGWAGRAGGASRGPAPSIARFDDPAVAERKRHRLQQTWRQSVPLTDARAWPVEQYLAARGLSDVLRRPPRVLRAHRSLEYWDGARLLGEFPALVALFHGSNDQPVTLHVTYLRGDGCAKAPVPSPRKILGVPVRGATRGGAIRLYEPILAVLGIAEGIESALSLSVLHSFPTWASFCADNLEHVLLPANLSELHIGVDVDESGTGERAARALAARVRNWRPTMDVTLWYPEIAGAGDLNDELMHKQRRAS